MIVGLLTVSKARLDMENAASALCNAAGNGDIGKVYMPFHIRTVHS